MAQAYHTTQRTKYVTVVVWPNVALTSATKSTVGRSMPTPLCQVCTKATAKVYRKVLEVYGLARREPQRCFQLGHS
eukprot:91199-Amphidinium_carterae.2